jgi:PleD family two-component response regulator
MLQAATGAVLAFNEEFSRQTFLTMVQRTGIENIRICSSCRDALLTVNQSARKWNLLILDSRTPDALETVRTLRRRIGPHIKILMVSSGPTREAVAEAIEAGVNDVMAYPVSQATLEKKLSRHVELPQNKVSLFKRVDSRSADIFTAKS